MGGLIFYFFFSFSIAFAQETTQSAKELYSNGKLLFDEGRYQDAITAWEKAYKISERALLLYNISLAQEALGQYQESIDTLYKYRIYAPKEEQENLSLKIEELTAKKEESKALKLSQEEKQAAAEAEAERQKREAEEKQATEKAEADRIRQEQERSVIIAAEKEQQLQKIKKLSYGAWGTSTAALGAGITFGIIAQNNYHSSDNDCGETATEKTICTADGLDYVNAASSYALVADLSYGVSALTAGTALWLTLKTRKPSTNDGATSLWVTPKMIGFQGQF